MVTSKFPSQVKLMVLDLGEPFPNIQDRTFVFGYGTGDTFNSIISLSSIGLRDFSFLVKQSQLSLVVTLINLLELEPNVVYVVDYHKHDLIEALAGRIPIGFSGLSNFQSTYSSNFINAWAPVPLYKNLFPSTHSAEQHFRDRIVRFQITASLPSRSAILFTSAGSGSSFNVPWDIVVDVLVKSGYTVFYNCSQKDFYTDLEFPGCIPLFADHADLISIFYNSPGLLLVGVRSGIFDIARLSDSKAFIFYHKFPDGTFRNCRFGKLNFFLDLFEFPLLDRFSSDQNEALIFTLSDFTSN